MVMTFMGAAAKPLFGALADLLNKRGMVALAIGVVLVISGPERLWQVGAVETGAVGIDHLETRGDAGVLDRPSQPVVGDYHRRRRLEDEAR